MKSTFELEMHCQSCAAVLPVTLQVMEGIQDVGLDENTLTVEHDAETVSQEELVEMRIFSGYYSATVRKVEQYDGDV